MSNLNKNDELLPSVAGVGSVDAIGELRVIRTVGVHDENDVISLNVLKNEISEATTTSSSSLSAAAETTTLLPTTPLTTKKLTEKRAVKLNVKIPLTDAEAEAEAKAKAKVKASTAKTTTIFSSLLRENYVETENDTLSNIKNLKTTSSLSSPSPSAFPPTPPPSLSSSPSTSSATATSSAPDTATIFPHEQYKSNKKLNIGFENVTFSVRTGFFKRENKSILSGLTGLFKAGELSAIVGPSGAGKSTLLNIISAYTPYGYAGEITVNGDIRDIKAFKPNIAFITQDTTLQPYLTVKEAMHFSANLKIGNHMTKSEKRERVRKILEAIGMYENRHTRTGNLSGGQKKRLAIALELVNNPPVLILDEPTSGLDSSIANQCILLLKKLAMEGRTVICTIHQPSALTFKMFDHLYAIAEGKCIYTGGPQNLVPFLAEIDLNCPESYNPADYLLEIATHDYGKQNHKLTEKIQNGRNDSYRQGKSAKKIQKEAIAKLDQMAMAGLATPVVAPLLTPNLYYKHRNNSRQQEEEQQQQQQHQLTPIKEMSSKVWDSRGILNDDGQNTKEQQQQQQQQSESSCCKPKPKPKLQLDPAHLCKRENIYATPFYQQLYILLVRTFLILWRDKSLTTMRFVIHFVTALLIGFLYYNIGNDAANSMNILRYSFYTIMFIMYCAFSSILVNFPLEFPIVSREHFNRWYSLRAYYVAMTLADIPIQIICTNLFILTTYYLTGQPFELTRLCLFSLIVFLTALVGQSIGLTVGASLSVQLGAIFGPFFICPFLAFSGFFLQEKDAPFYMKWMFDVSFLRYSLDGAMLSLFGYDRPKLECSSLYCHYGRPKIFLKDMGMEEASYEFAAIFLLALFIGLRIIAFYIMSFRLRLFR